MALGTRQRGTQGVVQIGAASVVDSGLLTVGMNVRYGKELGTIAQVAWGSVDIRLHGGDVVRIRPAQRHCVGPRPPARAFATAREVHM